MFDHLRAETKADEVVPFVIGNVMTIALIAYLKKEFVRNFFSLPVITSQLFGFAFFKSEFQFQDELESGEHPRWQYIWAFQFFTILVVVLLWLALYGVLAVSSDSKKLFEKFSKCIRAKFPWSSGKCCSCTCCIVLIAGIALLTFTWTFFEVACIFLFNRHAFPPICIFLFSNVFLIIFVIFMRRYRYLLCDFLLNMGYLVPTSFALYGFVMLISPTYVNAIRDIVAFSFLAFSIVRCFSSCFLTSQE